MTTAVPRESDVTGDVEEAGTDEVSALASMIAREPHVPAPRSDEEDEDQLPMAEVTEEGAVERVLPRQHDEFTCPRCFLVVHVSGRVGDVCRDCT